MNSRERWRSSTQAWTCPVSRSIPASRLNVPRRLYSWSRAMHVTGDRWQVWGSVGDRLDARFLIIRNERDVRFNLICRLGFRFGGTGLGRVSLRRSQDGNLLINTQDFGHLGFKFRIAPLQVVAHLVRLHLLISKDLAHRALRNPHQAGVPRCRTMLAGMAGQQPRRPEFVRMSHVLGLLAGKGHQPRARFHRNFRFSAGPRTVVERRHNAEPRRTRQATLDGLVRHADRSPDRVVRRILSVAQQYPGALHAARRLSSRASNRSKLRHVYLFNRNLHNLPQCCHEAHLLRTTGKALPYLGTQQESHTTGWFHGIDVLVRTKVEHMRRYGKNFSPFPSAGSRAREAVPLYPNPTGDRSRRALSFRRPVEAL